MLPGVADTDGTADAVPTSVTKTAEAAANTTISLVCMRCFMQILPFGQRTNTRHAHHSTGGSVLKPFEPPFLDGFTTLQLITDGMRPIWAPIARPQDHLKASVARGVRPPRRAGGRW